MEYPSKAVVDQMLEDLIKDGNSGMFDDPDQTGVALAKYGPAIGYMVIVSIVSSAESLRTIAEASKVQAQEAKLVMGAMEQERQEQTQAPNVTSERDDWRGETL